MGRIAEALKRAQEERAQRLERESCARGTKTAESTSGSRVSSASGAGDVLDSALTDKIVDVPEVPAPLPIGVAPILPTAIDPRVIALHDSNSLIAEKYRSVRTRLITGNLNGGSRALAITSSLPKEGKTVTVANLAFSLAELRHLRVTMIDLDLRHRGLTRLLGVQDQPGMAELLRGENILADVCVPVVRENLYFIPAGDASTVSPSELLAGSRATAVFKEINERFHYSLIDTPAMNTVADIGLIAPLCHSVLMVIRMNRTPEPVLRRSVQMLQANRVAITGCILAGYADEGRGTSGEGRGG